MTSILYKKVYTKVMNNASLEAERSVTLAAIDISFRQQFMADPQKALAMHFLTLSQKEIDYLSVAITLAADGSDASDFPPNMASIFLLCVGDFKLHPF